MARAVPVPGRLLRRRPCGAPAPWLAIGEPGASAGPSIVVDRHLRPASPLTPDEAFQALPHGHQLAPGVDAELCIDVLQMGPYRPDGDDEVGGDVLVGGARGRQAGDGLL